MSQSQIVPKHLWIVGILGLLWDLVGVYDYLMTQTRNEAYLAKFTPEQLEYFTSFPVWFEFFWAIAIWGGVLGCVLLLLRKKLATMVLLVSFASMCLTAVYSYGLSNGMEVMGSEGLIFTIIIFFIALGLWLYARAMQQRNVLT